MAKQYSLVIFLLAVTAFAGSSRENDKPSKPSSKKRKEPPAKPTQAKPKKTRTRETQTPVRLPEPRALMRGESPGFKNLGNTCFMNSALQSLYAVKSFWRKLKALKRDRMRKGKPVRPWVELLIKFKESWATNIASPNEIRDKMKEDMRLNIDGAQEDARDFLTELIQPRTTPSNDPNLHIPDTLWNVFNLGYPSATIPDMLDIPADEENHTLEELLDEAHKTANRDMLGGAPQILIFSLGIFHQEHIQKEDGLDVRTYKKRNKIDIGENLNMKKYIQGEETDQFYSLRSVIYHSGGSLNSGHYFAHVKENGKWVEKNDTPFRSIELPEQAKATAHKGDDIPYILFYEKKLAKKTITSE